MSVTISLQILLAYGAFVVIAAAAVGWIVGYICGEANGVRFCSYCGRSLPHVGIIDANSKEKLV